MADDSLFDHYRTPEDRKLMAEHVLRRDYNWDTRPEILEMVLEDLRAMNHVELAYLYREAGGGEESAVRKLADNFNPWKI